MNQCLKVDELSANTGVAKTSFYHYHNNRENFVDNLIEWWATVRWNEVQTSLQAVLRAGTTESLVQHKLAFIDFYCFYVRLKSLFEISKTMASAIRDIEENLRQFHSEFLNHFVPEGDKSEEIVDFISTYMHGWNYLHSLEVYNRKSGYKKYLNELSLFIKSLSQEKEVKQVS
jgi:AcrR family transcriptional regulator